VRRFSVGGDLLWLFFVAIVVIGTSPCTFGHGRVWYVNHYPNKPSYVTDADLPPFLSPLKLF